MAPAILVTGTGSTAREVLLALLRRTSARVALLMPDRRQRPARQRAAALFDRLALDDHERARVDVVAGDVALPSLGLTADIQGRLTDSLHAIVHTACTRSGVGAGRDTDRSGTANTLLLAERCFMAGRLQRFVHANGETDDRMVRAAMNAGLPVTIVGPGAGAIDYVVSAIARPANAQCA